MICFQSRVQQRAAEQKKITKQRNMSENSRITKYSHPLDSAFSTNSYMWDGCMGGFKQAGLRRGDPDTPPYFDKTEAHLLIFFLFAQTGCLTVCEHPGTAAYLLKNCLHPPLKIPGSAPGLG